MVPVRFATHFRARTTAKNYRDRYGVISLFFGWGATFDFRQILAPRPTPEMAEGGLLGPISSKRGGFRNFRLSRLKDLVLLFKMSIVSRGLWLRATG